MMLMKLIFPSHAIVRLKASPDYEIVRVTGDVEEVVAEDEEKCVDATEGTPVSVFFNIRPRVVGALNISVRATLPPPVNIYDEVIRTLPAKVHYITNFSFLQRL